MSPYEKEMSKKFLTGMLWGVIINQLTTIIIYWMIL